MDLARGWPRDSCLSTDRYECTRWVQVGRLSDALRWARVGVGSTTKCGLTIRRHPSLPFPTSLRVRVRLRDSSCASIYMDVRSALHV